MRILLFILCFFLVTSCKASKESFKVDQVNKIEKVNDIERLTENDKEEIANIVLTQLVSENTSVKVVKTTYDTEKPIDRETKRAPIREELEVNIDKKIESDTNQSLDSKVADKSKESLNDKSKLKDNSISKLEDKKSTGLNWYQKMMIWIGSLSLLGGVGYLVYRFKFK